MRSCSRLSRTQGVVNGPLDSHSVLAGTKPTLPTAIRFPSLRCPVAALWLFFWKASLSIQVEKHPIKAAFDPVHPRMPSRLSLRCGSAQLERAAMVFDAEKRSATGMGLMSLSGMAASTGRARRERTGSARSRRPLGPGSPRALGPPPGARGAPRVGAAPRRCRVRLGVGPGVYVPAPGGGALPG